MSIPQTEKIAALAARVEARLPGLVQRVPALADELCYEVQPANIKQVCLALRDDPGLRFEILVDVAGIDYLHYATSECKTLSATTSGFSRSAIMLSMRVRAPGTPHWRTLASCGTKHVPMRQPCSSARSRITSA